MKENTKRLWILFALICTVHGYSRFRNLIPNGRRVPHPCDRNRIWDAVGHTEPYHTTTKNAFGLAFLRNGKTWRNVCSMDSDGDGKTNGEELGDPLCQWSPTNGHQLRDPEGHPGYCDQSRDINCTSQTRYQCQDNNRSPMAGPGLQFDVRTPSPHFGKHPQSLLTERLGERSGTFGGQMGGPQGLGRFSRGRNLPGSFGSFGQPPSFSQSSRFDQSSFSDSVFDSNMPGAGSMAVTEPPISGSFGMPRQSYPLDVPRQPMSRSFGVQDRPGSTSLDWSRQSSGTFGQPSGGSFSGSFGGVETPSQGSNFWQPSQPSPSQGFEPTRDSFALNLNQRFLQGGVPEPNGMPFRGQSTLGFPVAQSNQRMLERQVNRRIQQARHSSRRRPGVSAVVDWQGGAMGSMGGMGSQFIPQSGGRGGFMFT